MSRPPSGYDPARGAVVVRSSESGRSDRVRRQLVGEILVGAALHQRALTGVFEGVDLAALMQPVDQVTPLVGPLTPLDLAAIGEVLQSRNRASTIGSAASALLITINSRTASALMSVNTSRTAAI